MKNVIFHIDVNSAFLSWEAVYRLFHRGGTLDLREIPSAVGGDVSLRHGIILAKSIPAKDYGIKTGESIPEARRKCPNLVLVPPNYSLYEQCLEAFMDILREYSDVVEQYSIDESFVDMTTTCHLFGTPEETATQLKDRIREELGFTVNIGVSSNKLLAKMASDFRRPDRVHTLYPEEIPQKMWPLPVSELFFVGRATAKKLFSMGIRTIGELAADKVLLASTDLTVEICRAARELFAELWDHRPVRLLGVHTSRVRRDDFSRQMSFFDEVDYGKLADMDRTVDAIRERYGCDAVMRAAFLNQPIDHMSGGISREKWKVDYDKVAVL